MNDVLNSIRNKIMNGGWGGRTVGYGESGGILTAGNLQECKRNKADLYYAWLATYANKKECWQGKCVTFGSDFNRCGNLAETSSKTLEPAADGLAEISSEANGTKDQSLEETVTRVSEGNHDQSLEESLTDKRTC
jgi:hypothetical protein